MTINSAKRKLGSMLKLSRHSFNFGLIKHSFIGADNSKKDEKLHLESAIDWIIRAQDISNNGGVSAGYSLTKGWLPPYPETTGYIIQTFAICSEILNRKDLLERAIRMADWEMSIQFPYGAIPGGWGINSYPIVFNTGQVVLGWNTLYFVTGEKRFLEASIKASEWLISIIDDDGCWRKHTYNDIPHVYNSRVSWALLQLAELSGDDRFRKAATRSIDWILKNTTENGYFNYMSFSNEKPFTHNVAYTLSGILESMPYIQDRNGEILDKILRPSNTLIDKYILKNSEKKIVLPARFDPNWESEDSFTCLTGNVQFAQIFYILSRITGDSKYGDAGDKLLESVKNTQSIYNKNPGIRGAIAGSFPIYGKYLRFTFPNWAAKFFIDAILEKMFGKSISLIEFNKIEISEKPL